MLQSLQRIYLFIQAERAGYSGFFEDNWLISLNIDSQDCNSESAFSQSFNLTKSHLLLMLQGLLYKLVDRLLGEYFSGFDRKSLKLAFWEGNVTINNIFIKPSFFNSLKLPFVLAYSFISKVTLKVPWKNLSAKPVEIFLDGVNVIIKDKSLAQTKDKVSPLIQRLSSLIQECIGKQGQKEEKGYFDSILIRVVDNLQVNLSNLHLRYESEQFSLGVLLQELSLYTTNAKGEKEFIDRTIKSNIAAPILKKGLLRRLFIYLDTAVPLISDIKTQEERNQAMIRQGLAEAPHQMMMQLDLELKINKSLQSITLQFQLERLDINISKDQLDKIVVLVNLWSEYNESWVIQSSELSELQLSKMRSLLIDMIIKSLKGGQLTQALSRQQIKFLPHIFNLIEQTELRVIINKTFNQNKKIVKKSGVKSGSLLSQKDLSQLKLLLQNFRIETQAYFHAKLDSQDIILKGTIKLTEIRLYQLDRSLTLTSHDFSVSVGSKPKLFKVEITQRKASLIFDSQKAQHKLLQFQQKGQAFSCRFIREYIGQGLFQATLDFFVEDCYYKHSLPAMDLVLLFAKIEPHRSVSKKAYLQMQRLKQKTKQLLQQKIISQTQLSLSFISKRLQLSLPLQDQFSLVYNVGSLSLQLGTEKSFPQKIKLQVLNSSLLLSNDSQKIYITDQINVKVQGNLTQEIIELAVSLPSLNVKMPLRVIDRLKNANGLLLPAQDPLQLKKQILGQALIISYVLVRNLLGVWQQQIAVLSGSFIYLFKKKQDTNYSEAIKVRQFKTTALYSGVKNVIQVSSGSKRLRIGFQDKAALLYKWHSLLKEIAYRTAKQQQTQSKPIRFSLFLDEVRLSLDGDINLQIFLSNFKLKTCLDQKWSTDASFDRIVCKEDEQILLRSAQNQQAFELSTCFCSINLKIGQLQLLYQPKLILNLLKLLKSNQRSSEMQIIPIQNQQLKTPPVEVLNIKIAVSKLHIQLQHFRLLRTIFHLKINNALLNIQHAQTLNSLKARINYFRVSDSFSQGLRELWTVKDGGDSPAVQIGYQKNAKLIVILNRNKVNLFLQPIIRLIDFIDYQIIGLICHPSIFDSHGGEFNAAVNRQLDDQQCNQDLFNANKIFFKIKFQQLQVNFRTVKGGERSLTFFGEQLQICNQIVKEQIVGLGMLPFTIISSVLIGGKLEYKRRNPRILGQKINCVLQVRYPSNSCSLKRVHPDFPLINYFQLKIKEIQLRASQKKITRLRQMIKAVLEDDGQDKLFLYQLVESPFKNEFNFNISKFCFKIEHKSQQALLLQMTDFAGQIGKQLKMNFRMKTVIRVNRSGQMVGVQFLDGQFNMYSSEQGFAIQIGNSRLGLDVQAVRQLIIIQNRLQLPGQSKKDSKGSSPFRLKINKSFLVLESKPYPFECRLEQLQLDSKADFLKVGIELSIHTPRKTVLKITPFSATCSSLAQLYLKLEQLRINISLQEIQSLVQYGKSLNQCLSNNSQTRAQTFPVKSMTVSLPSVKIVLTNKQSLPLLRMHLHNFQLRSLWDPKKQAIFQVDISSDYFNSKIMTWQPLLTVLPVNCVIYFNSHLSLFLSKKHRQGTQLVLTTQLLQSLREWSAGQNTNRQLLFKNLSFSPIILQEHKTKHRLKVGETLNLTLNQLDQNKLYNFQWRNQQISNLRTLLVLDEHHQALSKITLKSMVHKDDTYHPHFKLVSFFDQDTKILAIKRGPLLKNLSKFQLRLLSTQIIILIPPFGSQSCPQQFRLQIDSQASLRISLKKDFPMYIDLKGIFLRLIRDQNQDILVLPSWSLQNLLPVPIRVEYRLGEFVLQPNCKELLYLDYKNQLLNLALQDSSPCTFQLREGRQSIRLQGKDSQFFIQTLTQSALSLQLLFYSERLIVLYSQLRPSLSYYLYNLKYKVSPISREDSQIYLLPKCTKVRVSTSISRVKLDISTLGIKEFNLEHRNLEEEQNQQVSIVSLTAVVSPISINQKIDTIKLTQIHPCHQLINHTHKTLLARQKDCQMHVIRLPPGSKQDVYWASHNHKSLVFTIENQQWEWSTGLSIQQSGQKYFFLRSRSNYRKRISMQLTLLQQNFSKLASLNFASADSPFLIQNKSEWLKAVLPQLPATLLPGQRSSFCWQSPDQQNQIELLLKGGGGIQEQLSLKIDPIKNNFPQAFKIGGRMLVLSLRYSELTAVITISDQYQPAAPQISHQCLLSIDTFKVCLIDNLLRPVELAVVNLKGVQLHFSKALDKSAKLEFKVQSAQIFNTSEYSPNFPNILTSRSPCLLSLQLQMHEGPNLTVIDKMQVHIGRFALCLQSSFISKVAEMIPLMIRSTKKSQLKSEKVKILRMKLPRVEIELQVNTSYLQLDTVLDLFPKNRSVSFQLQHLTAYIQEEYPLNDIIFALLSGLTISPLALIGQIQRNVFKTDGINLASLPQSLLVTLGGGIAGLLRFLVIVPPGTPTPKHFIEGLEVGTVAMIRSLALSFRMSINQPIEAFRNQGLGSSLLYSLKSAGRLAITPFNAVLVFMYKGIEGLRNTAKHGLQVSQLQRRKPRAFYGEQMRIKPYQSLDAEAYAYLQNLEKGQLQDQGFIKPFMVTKEGRRQVLIVLSRSLLVVDFRSSRVTAKVQQQAWPSSRKTQKGLIFIVNSKEEQIQLQNQQAEQLLNLLSLA